MGDNRSAPAAPLFLSFPAFCRNPAGFVVIFSKKSGFLHTLQLNLPGRRGTMCFDCMKRGGQLSMLHIVLVEPEIPQNCGNVARTCAATGSQSHLIRPLGFDISEKAVRRAGLDYWNLVEVFDYENLEDFFPPPPRGGAGPVAHHHQGAPVLSGGPVHRRQLAVLRQGDRRVASGSPGAVPGPAASACPWSARPAA